MSFKNVTNTNPLVNLLCNNKIFYVIVILTLNFFSASLYRFIFNYIQISLFLTEKAESAKLQEIEDKAKSENLDFNFNE